MSKQITETVKFSHKVNFVFIICLILQVHFADEKQSVDSSKKELVKTSIKIKNQRDEKIRKLVDKNSERFSI